MWLAEIWKRISSSGITVALSYGTEIIASRLSDDVERPLLLGTQGEERKQRISDLIKRREPYYRRADLFLHFDEDVPLASIVDRIANYVRGDA